MARAFAHEQRSVANPTQPIAPGALITQPDQPWEKGVIHNNYPITEGRTALYHDDKTFIVYSGSNTMSANYCMGLLTYLGEEPPQQPNWKKNGPVSGQLAGAMERRESADVRSKGSLASLSHPARSLLK
jgi:GH43 family beta-xylosidase